MVNSVALVNKIVKLVTLIRIGIGISRTISISNTIKIIARRKKRIENGIRALWFGSNPHSNGDDFSRFIVDRAAVNQAIANTNVGKVIATKEEIIIKVIY